MAGARSAGRGARNGLGLLHAPPPRTDAQPIIRSRQGTAHATPASMSTTDRKLALTFLAAVVNITACARSEAAPDPGSGARPHRVLTISGARDPESVRYDADLDAYFISMMNGFGSYKDNNGYIVRVPAGEPSQLTIFAESGKNGVRLDAPKGMALQGDTLWVADIDRKSVV